MDLLPLASRDGSLASQGGARAIRALPGAVTRDEAIEAFAGGIAGRARRFALGPLRSIADVYVPFRLYRVNIERAALSHVERSAPGRIEGRTASRWRRIARHATIESAVLGLDAVSGALDLYRFDREPGPDDLVCVQTRNGVAAALSDAALHEIAVARVRRMVYGQRGFLVAGALRVDVQPIDADVHVPYWTGFFGSGEAARMVVMDAVRRQIEGAKVRQLIGRWLTADAG